MGYPLESLIEYNGNMYEITSAIIRRSYQLAVLRDPFLDRDDDKIVSESARQIFSEEVVYQVEA